MHETVWSGMEWPGMACHGVAWHGGLKWHVMECHGATHDGLGWVGGASPGGCCLSSQPSARPGWQPRKSAAKVVAASQQVKRGNEETRNAGTQERRNAGTQERWVSSPGIEPRSAARAATREDHYTTSDSNDEEYQRSRIYCRVWMEDCETLEC